MKKEKKLMVDRAGNATKYMSIITWLYQHHEAFPSAAEWRNAFVDYLIEVFEMPVNKEEA